MPICYTCGGEIEFRYMGGRLVPIHVNGGGCSSYSRGPAGATFRPFRTLASYVNPNARCPVCGKAVFYYQSPHGGRVFFDHLGWPWPKHPCTDNPRSQHLHVETLPQNSPGTFRSAQGEPLDLYELLSLDESDGVARMRFGKLGENRSFNVSVPVRGLHGRGIKIDDLNAAPSFVVRTYETYRIIEFISGRNRRIDGFKATRPVRHE